MRRQRGGRGAGRAADRAGKKNKLEEGDGGFILIGRRYSPIVKQDFVTVIFRVFRSGQDNRKTCSRLLFLIALILWNNSALTISKVLCTRNSTSYADPGLKIREHLRFCFCYLTIQCNCSACEVSPDKGLQKRATFSTLIVGLLDFLHYFASKFINW
jgi:hypothetical protein